MEQGGWQEDQYSGGGQMQREWPELRESEGNGKNDVSNNAGHMYASGLCLTGAGRWGGRGGQKGNQI